MGSLVRRAAAVVAAGAVACALGVTGVAAAGAVTQARQRADTVSLATAHGLAVRGANLWIQRYNDPGNGADVASSVAVSPSGSRVFVTGASAGATAESDYLTVAYNAATGARLWTARYNGPGNSLDSAKAVAVTPDGATVFVTGTSGGGSGSLQDYATVAYRASDGTQLWVARFNSPVNDNDNADAVSVARDGTAVFVTGSTWDGSASSMTTVAYRASDGARQWVKSWSAPGANYNGNAIVSPGGNRVIVTGHVQSKRFFGEYGTVAYNATTGARLWERRYAGLGATSIAASPDRSRVYVTGESHFDYTTLAYSARTGARLWLRRYDGGKNFTNFANSVAVSPGGKVFVTGGSRGPTGSSAGDYATVAYSPGGARLWARRYSGPGNKFDVAYGAAAPGNGKVYVTGTIWDGSAAGHDYATIAYSIRTGARLWVRRYNGPASGEDSATALASLGGRVFVTGFSAGTTSGDDYATIAYND